MMKQKINVGHILKSYPKETELYSPICGKCYLENVNHNYIVVVTPTGESFSFNYDGTYCILGEIMLFPSKENKNWSNITQKICDGDVVVAEDADTTQMFIVQNCLSLYEAKCYIGYEFESNTIYDAGNWAFNRIASEEEKQKLFDAIKAHGYKWNAETKTLEKLVEPKFKVGDRIKSKINQYEYTIMDIRKDVYIMYYSNDKDKFDYHVPFCDEDKFDLVLNKFDINTLVPFESRVLVRDSIDAIEEFNDEREAVWIPAIWGGVNIKDNAYPFGVVGGCYFRYCIPYEKNEHLLGTTDDCDEFYKN